MEFLIIGQFAYEYSEPVIFAFLDDCVCYYFATLILATFHHAEKFRKILLYRSKIHFIEAKEVRHFRVAPCLYDKFEEIANNIL